MSRQKGFKHSKETRLKIAKANKGKIRTLDVRKKYSLAKQNYIPWNKGLKGYLSGEKHYKYVKDRTLLKPSQNRGSDTRYGEWQKNVYKRDNWKCKINNNSCQGKIEAHHILRFSEYPELKYDINNGITLCHFHHPRKKNEETKLSIYFKELIKN